MKRRGVSPEAFVEFIKFLMILKLEATSKILLRNYDDSGVIEVKSPNFFIVDCRRLEGINVSKLREIPVKDFAREVAGKLDCDIESVRVLSVSENEIHILTRRLGEDVRIVVRFY